MKRLTIPILLLYSLSLASMAQGTEWLDHERLRDLTIYRVLETNKPLELVETRYAKLLQAAENDDNDYLQAICLFQLAHINYTQTHYSHSLAWAKKGMTLANRLNDHEMLAVGYDLLGRLHYLYSPEQAQYYYQKCWQQCQRSVGNELAITSLNSYTLTRNDYGESLNSLLSIDLHSLTDLSKARLSYLIARSLTDAGYIEEAARYLRNTGKYLEQHHETSPLNILFAQQMAKVMLCKGNTKKALEYIHQSYEIACNNKLLLEQVETYRLVSEIAQAENQGALALKYYKKSISLRDSILSTADNLNLADELLYTMVEYISEDNYQANHKRNIYTVFYVTLVLVLILAFGFMYCYKSAFYRRKVNVTLTGIKAQTRREYHARLKNLMMGLVHNYKTGFYFCMKHALAIKQQENTGNNHGYEILQKHSQKADDFISMLLEWTNSGPDMERHSTEFDVKYLIDQIVALYQITFSHKHLTYRQFISDDPLIVYGDKILFAIAIEHLFSRIVRNAVANDTIHISAAKNEDGQFVFGISNPGDRRITYAKEIFARHVEIFEKTEKEIRTADWDFNIFTMCLLRNRAKIRFNFSADSGTGCGITMPAA